MNVAYWFIIGTVYLIILTYQDYKNKMNVDDRYNFFMMGLSVSLYSHSKHTILYIFVILGMTFLVYFYLKRFLKIGEGDIKAFTWIFLGLTIINLYYTFLFFIILSIVTILYSLIKRFIFNIKGATPYFGVILISFIINGFLSGGYWNGIF